MSSQPRNPRPRPSSLGKKLIVTCDGTWLDSTATDAGQLEHPSNVARIGWAMNDVDRHGRPQIVFYQNGIGSQGGILRRLQGGLTGEGFKENVREAYSFIATNYAEGDEIYLIGFSRGAFTARSVAGMFKAIGLLTKDGLPYFSEIFEDYVHRRDRDYRSKYPNIPFPKKPSASNPAYKDGLVARDMTETQVTIKAIAVWETVGSLGIPRVPWLEQLGLQSRKMKGYQFYDTNLGNHIENAFQALALDEKRAAFLPAVWELPRDCTTHLKQCWFPGTHSNVGGGYPDQEIANITLAWMMAQLERFIDFDEDYLMVQYEMNRKYYREKRKKKRPWSFGKIYNSLTPVYVTGGITHRTPGNYYRVDRDTGKPTDRPLRNTHEYIHPSVRTRIYLHGPGTEDLGDYSPQALEGWEATVDDRNLNQKNSTVVWKAPPKLENVNRVLPESVLKGTELELLEKSPKMYDFVLSRST